MVEQQDSFWKLFFTVTAGILALAAFVISILVIKPSETPPTLPYNSSEPYTYAEGMELIATSTYLYRESIPLGYSNTSWSALTDWRSEWRHFEGRYAARAEFTESWGGLSLAGQGLPSQSYAGISFAVFAEAGITDLYLELYNERGMTVGRQSVGWYFPNGALETGHWQMVTIPLANFATVPKTVGGFAIISDKKGVIYVDDVHLTKSTASHAAWVPAPEVAGTSTEVSLSDLFARTTPAPLPFWVKHQPQEMFEWHASGGYFVIDEKGIKIGPPAQGGGTHATFLGGRIWTDYRVDADVNWGPATSVSLAARIQDENSQVACGFSQLGTVVQIYEMKNGESRLVRESAYVEMELPSRLEWAKVPISIEVKGNRINCYAYGKLLLGATLEHMPPAGSVGIEVWDPEKNREPHLIRVFSVRQL